MKYHMRNFVILIDYWMFDPKKEEVENILFHLFQATHPIIYCLKFDSDIFRKIGKNIYTQIIITL